MPPRGYMLTHRPLFKTESLAFCDFVDRVGKLSLSDWNSLEKSTKSNIEFVLNDILYALTTGIITACVVINVRSSLTLESCDVQFLVDTSFWCDDQYPAEKAFELQSFLQEKGRVPCDYLYNLVELRKSPLSASFQEVRFRSTELFIVDPTKILSELVDFAELPPESWFKRYAVYRQRFTAEMIAAAWRLVYLENKHGNKLQASKIRDGLDAYFRQQGLADKQLPSMSKLYQIARQICDQAERDDSTSSIFVSPNPKTNVVQSRVSRK